MGVWGLKISVYCQCNTTFINFNIYIKCGFIYLERQALANMRRPYLFGFQALLYHYASRQMYQGFQKNQFSNFLVVISNEILTWMLLKDQKLIITFNSDMKLKQHNRTESKPNGAFWWPSLTFFKENIFLHKKWPANNKPKKTKQK